MYDCVFRLLPLHQNEVSYICNVKEKVYGGAGVWVGVGTQLCARLHNSEDNSRCCSFVVLCLGRQKYNLPPFEILA